MTAAILSLYGRALRLVRERPGWIAVPVLAEAAQHVAEIEMGMYSGDMDASGQMIRLGFGLAKSGAVLFVLIAAWRLWRFEADTTRPLRPNVALFKGIAIFILVQLAGSVVALLVGRGLLLLVGDVSRNAQLIFGALPLLGWLLISVALFPWYVGLCVEDRTMTLRASLIAARGTMLFNWMLFAAAIVPLMAVHYAIGYAALGGAPAWPLMAIDSIVVGVMAAVLAATYYTIYARAVERIAGPRSRMLCGRPTETG